MGNFFFIRPLSHRNWWTWSLGKNNKLMVYNDLDLHHRPSPGQTSVAEMTRLKIRLEQIIFAEDNN